MMRFLPDVFTDTFEDMWKDPFFTKSNSCMKTDVRELDGNYLLDMELPGYKKEDIHLDLKDGYLNITAARLKKNALFLLNKCERMRKKHPFSFCQPGSMVY